MKRGREKLLSHTLMVVAPLLALFMITVAWFVNSRTIGLSELSFASQDAGPGATVYPTKKLGNRLPSDKAMLTYDSITWGEKLAPEESGITIENMVPGQCVYYLLSSDKKFTPRLLNVTITDADGNKVTTTPDNETLLLTQCVGLYLIPTEIDMTLPDPVSTNVSLALTRTDGSKLDAALFAGDPSTVTFPPLGEAEIKNAYILGVFCDPIYGQEGPEHIATLPGSISFSLAFDTVGES